MKSYFIRFKPFILITTFLVIAAPIFIYTFNLHPFKTITINKTLSNLSPAVDLTGVWTGTATFRNSDKPDFWCTFSGPITIELEQKSNKIQGQFTFAEEKGIPSSSDVICEEGTTTVQISAKVSGSRIELFEIPDGFGTFEGSFTTDTLTLNQVEFSGFKLMGSIKLSRK